MTPGFLEKIQSTGCKEYFEPAEKDAPYQFNTFINPYLPDLNDKVVVEIACGHGRLTERLVNKFSPLHVILVDINPDNIAFCQKRFKGDNFSFIKNNGQDIDGIKDHSVDFVYSFDSMVHFNYELVAGYVAEIKRVLKKGARCFIHFSNHGASVAGEELGDGLRGAMTNKQMLDLLQDCNIIHNEIIDWGGVKNLDAIVVFEV